MKRIIAVPLFLALALTGCSGGKTDSQTSDSANPSQQEVDPAAKAELEKIKTRIVDAGFDCEKWTDEKAFPLATASGSCTGMRIGYYDNPDDIAAQLEVSKKYSKEHKLSKRSWVVGDNFVVESGDAKSIGKELDEKVESF